MNYANDVTPQTESSREDQVLNSAGGYTFAVSNWIHAQRFLILGNEGGSYYTTQAKLTRTNAKNVEKCWNVDPKRMAGLISDISVNARSYKNDACIFALALGAASSNFDARKYALAELSNVCRIPTHLFLFIEMVKTMRGWGRSLRTAIADWYLQKPLDTLAYQCVKYRKRSGWTHRDVLRVAHPKTDNFDRDALFAYLTNKDVYLDMLPKIIEGFELAQDGADLLPLISKYKLTREMLPTDSLVNPAVWKALLENMPMTAMIRNLGNMSKVGLLTETNWDEVNIVTDRLTDTTRLQKARIHPLQILVALKTYEAGHGVLGKGTWNTVPAINAALDKAFYKTFDNVEPTNARIMIGLDVSGSMGWSYLAGIPTLSAREAAAAMCMTHLRTEKNVIVKAFTATRNNYRNTDKTDISGFETLKLHSRQSLSTVIRDTTNIPFGATDCSLPMRYALYMGIPVDAFIIYTDNETWAGVQHPYEALQDYRLHMGINAKLIVVGMTATEFSIADPSDPGMLDVVGMDTSTPNIINEFILGRI